MRPLRLGGEKRQFHLIIEQAKTQDAAEILALQKLAYRSEAAIYDDYGIPPLTQTLAEMETDLYRQTVLKATIDGLIIGSVRAYEQEATCYIGRLIVHPDHQNQGIGTQLLQSVEAAFPQAKRFELFTGHKSARNLHLYRKLGYVAFKREPLGDAVTVVFLEKRR